MRLRCRGFPPRVGYQAPKIIAEQRNFPLSSMLGNKLVSRDFSHPQPSRVFQLLHAASNAGFSAEKIIRGLLRPSRRLDCSTCFAPKCRPMSKALPRETKFSAFATACAGKSGRPLTTRTASAFLRRLASLPQFGATVWRYTERVRRFAVLKVHIFAILGITSRPARLTTLHPIAMRNVFTFAYSGPLCCPDPFDVILVVKASRRPRTDHLPPSRL